MTQERRREEGSDGMGWPAATFWIVVVLTVLACYLGDRDALPWQ